MLANRMQLITEASTSAMRNKAKQLKEEGIPVINFAAGELDIDTSNEIKLAAKEAIDQGYNKYTDTLGIHQLRTLIAERISKETEVTYLKEEVGVTVGAKQALFNTAMVLFEEGDEVIIPSPYWVTFPIQVKLSGATPVFLDTEKFDYQINIEELKKLISSKTKAIIINSPNNPTGIVYSNETLENIAKLAIEHNFWIIFDECYNKLIHMPHEYNNIVKLVKEVKERTILINSFSKACALTGWRVGYVCGPQPVIKAVQKLQGHMTSNVCSISQYAVLASFDGSHIGFIEKVKKTLKNRLDIALQIINTMENVSYIEPQGAFYLFLNMQKILGKYYNNILISDISVLTRLLLEEAQIAVVSGDGFGSPIGIRLSYAIATEDVRNGLYNLKRFLEKVS
jgi:aspartate aminotransferase